MATMHEFTHIASQLEWLERHLRTNTPTRAEAGLDDALDALACARAVMAELAQIGSETPPPLVATAVSLSPG